MQISRPIALALGVTALGCGLLTPGLNPPEAAKLVTAHPTFSAAVTRLPFAADVVDSSTGIDAGVLEGIWRYRGRDTSGQPSRELTAKGRESWADASGGLAAPGQRELVELAAVTDDKDNKKHKSATFTWRYRLPDTVRRFTGQEGTHTGQAEFSYDGAWKVTALDLDDKAGVFAWTATHIKDAQRHLSAEQEASTPRMLALETQKYTSLDGKTYAITISDADVAVDETEYSRVDPPKISRRTVTFVDFAGCKVDVREASAVLRVDGTRGSALVAAPAKFQPTFESLCQTTQEAYGSWVSRYKDVADRGPLGVSYSR